MALFLRVFISLFLLSSSNVFALGMDGGADVDYIYYERAGECSSSYQTFCTSDVFPKSTSNQLVTQIGCGLYGYSDPQAHYSTQWRAGWNVEPVGSIIFGNNGLAATRHKTCSSTEEFQLNGCTATCVTKPPEPCLAKKDQFKTLSVQCGTFNCPANSHTVLNGLIVCDKKGGYFTPSIPANSASYQGCALQAQAVPEFSVNDATGLNSEVGGQTQAGFCSVEYKYTGTSGSATDTPTMTNGTGFNVSYLPAGEGGQCDTGYKPGTKDGFNICVPDTGSTSACAKGEIRNNSGVCVPFAQAGLNPDGTKTNPDGSKTKENADGSTTTTSHKTTSNSNGTTTETTTKETTKPDGTKTKKTESITKNPDGTTTKKTSNETTLPNGKKLTSESETTTNDSDNGTNKKNDSTTSTSSSGTNPDGSSFDNKANDSSSTQNPDGTSSTGGDGGSCPNGGCSATTSGKCDTPPVCSGDPLVCASINQQWISTCKQTEALTTITTDQKTASDAAIAESNSAYAASKSSASSAASGILGGFSSSVESGSKSGTCIVDATLPVMGKSLKIPFSQACAFFKFLRMLVIFMSYLAAMRIVYKGAV